MKYRLAIRVAPLSLLGCLALSAPDNAEPLLVLQSTPTLRVFVYSFPKLSPVVLQGAESEAARLLRAAPINWQWINCTGRLALCWSSQRSIDLVIRLTARAIRPASARALGMTDDSSEYATAFLFYDRVLALQTQQRLLPVMLGRVLAHEITHLLLPQEGHATLGLMRGKWSVEDLKQSNTSCLGLSARSVRLMQREALRRDGTAH